jgi:hypothetical protein
MKLLIILAIVSLALTPAFPQDQSSSPDGRFTVKKSTEREWDTLRIQGPNIQGNPTIWISPYGYSNSLGTLRERIDKFIWAPKVQRSSSTRLPLRLLL